MSEARIRTMQPFGRESELRCEAVRIASDSFPLTPALSLRERGNRRQSASAFGIAETFECRARGFPLPKGEGRGEGEQDAASLYAPDRSMSHQPRVVSPAEPGIC